MDIQVQRLNPYVIESEIFESAIKIQSSKKLRRQTYHSGKQYGSLWTKEESDVADYIDEAYKLKITNANEIRQFICEKAIKLNPGDPDVYEQRGSFVRTEIGREMTKGKVS